MDIQKYINKAKTQGPDMSKAKGGTGGGGSDYTPPPQGPVLLRLVGYIETGKHEGTYHGETKLKDKVKLVFECHGKNYPNNDRITITETLSLHEKSNFRKLFLAMRGSDESITHMSELLGSAFRGKITHRSFNGRDGKPRTFANLKDASGYTIGPPVVEDPESGEIRTIPVPEPKTELKLFLWDFADQAMWDSLYIDGTYGEGRSKNVLQEEILSAVNFKGSALDRVLNGGSLESALEQAEATPPKTGGAFRPQGVSSRPAAIQSVAQEDPFGFTEYDQ